MAEMVSGKNTFRKEMALHQGGLLAGVLLYKLVSYFYVAGRFESQGEEKVGELSVELEALRSQLKVSEDKAVSLNNSLQQAREEVHKQCDAHPA